MCKIKSIKITIIIFISTISYIRVPLSFGWLAMPFWLVSGFLSQASVV